MNDPAVEIHRHPTGKPIATYTDQDGDRLTMFEHEDGNLNIRTYSGDLSTGSVVEIPTKTLLHLIEQIAPTSAREYRLDNPIAIEAGTDEDDREALARVRARVRALAASGVAPEEIIAAVHQALPPGPDDAEETPEERQRREVLEAAEQLGATLADLCDAFTKGLTR